MKQAKLEALLKDLQALPKECEWVEFKQNNSNPHEIGEYLSALSNGACYCEQQYGYLVFGIDNQNKRLIGTKFNPSMAKVGNEELENWLTRLLKPRVDFRIFEFDYEGNHFAIFRVEATIDLPVSFSGVPFIRIGSIKKKLTDHPERERKIWNKRNNSFEKNIAFDNVSAEKILELINCPAFFEMMGLPYPDNLNGIVTRLAEDKIIEKNGNSYDITNLGAILFGKNIELFETIARKSIRVIIYQGENKKITRKEQSGKLGYALGFQGLIRYIMDALPSSEIIENGLRKEKTLYPELAIRELVANAIIHQDFGVTGSSPMIEIFDNRIEITNPGKPLIDTLRFVDHSPQSRNERLASYMRRLKICEERGSGIDKVLFECELNLLPAPDFIAGDNYTRIILYSRKSLKEMDRKDKIRACYFHACLKFVSGEQMTNQSLRERFAIPEHNYSIVSRIIGDAKEAELIKDYDPDNKSKTYAKYVPIWA